MFLGILIRYTNLEFQNLPYQKMNEDFIALIKMMHRMNLLNYISVLFIWLRRNPH